ncbi:MAG TPA: hypothetical protein VFO37_03355, partial [Chitinophagaceae bacterium]|nr:hypothetical protein [Chitinophagaceae bacterium]
SKTNIVSSVTAMRYWLYRTTTCLPVSRFTRLYSILRTRNLTPLSGVSIWIEFCVIKSLAASS